MSIWDLQTGKIIFTLEEHGFFTKALQMSMDGINIMYGGDDGVMRIWNLAAVLKKRELIYEENVKYEIVLKKQKHFYSL